MRAAIYNPYLNTLGGGEKYTISFAKVLADRGFTVHMQWSDKSIKSRLEKRFEIKMDNIDIVDNIKAGDSYDICFWVSDGSVPTLKARKNILHFQVPFNGVNGRSLLNKMKLFRVNYIVCNSIFTKNVIDKEYGVDSTVIYPPVDIGKNKGKRKMNKILYVGRFSKLVQSKNQDKLIRAFKKMYDKGMKNWKLVLAGGVEVGVGNYIKNLKQIAKGYPVEIVESPSYQELVEMYNTSKIFWSAAGLGVNEKKEPQKMEHFGITTAEAMIAGCVPLVFNGGGQKEIVENNKNGYLWKDERELIKLTIGLINDNTLYRKLSLSASESVKKFTMDRFNKDVLSIINS